LFLATVISVADAGAKIVGIHSTRGGKLQPIFTMSFLRSDSGFTGLFQRFVRDLGTLLATSRIVKQALAALRSECACSAELSESLNDLVAVNDAGEAYLQRPLAQAGIVLVSQEGTDAADVVRAIFNRIPTGGKPDELTAEMLTSFRLLAQHLELKAHLAAEEDLLLGQEPLSSALMAWAVRWRNCGRRLGHPPVRSRPTSSNLFPFLAAAPAMS
jgi:hypothetical protein